MATSYNSGFDIANRFQNLNSAEFDAYVNRWEEQEKLKQLYEDKGTLSFTDMLSLMVAQFQNQTIDNQASTADMMNQLVQMSSMQAMNEMVDQVKELTLANVMSYSRSLLHEWVTLGVYDEKGNVTELYGQVEGVGTYNGQQVIFVNGQSYYLSSIMAVGKLPPKEGTDIDSGDGEGEDDVPTPPIEDSGTPDIDDDGNPIDTPTPPIKDDGEVDDPDSGSENSGAAAGAQETEQS